MTKPLTNEDGDVRELTLADMRRMKPMREVDPEFLELWHDEQKKRGRPQGRSKNVVSISLDKDVLEALRASGAGWQSRVNALLRAAVGLKP